MSSKSLAIVHSIVMISLPLMETTLYGTPRSGTTITTPATPDILQSNTNSSMWYYRTESHLLPQQGKRKKKKNKDKSRTAVALPMVKKSLYTYWVSLPHSIRQAYLGDQRSPPSSIVPRLLPCCITGLLEKSLKLRSRRVTVPGVRPAPGVLFQGTCAGLGVMLTKSAKSKACDGVCGPPNPDPSPLPPGVVIMDDGSARLRDGGVDGGCIRPRMDGFAGDGDVAR